VRRRRETDGNKNRVAKMQGRKTMERNLKNKNKNKNNIN
jgi:hypothetical protein